MIPIYEDEMTKYVFRQILDGWPRNPVDVYIPPSGKDWTELHMKNGNKKWKETAKGMEQTIES